MHKATKLLELRNISYPFDGRDSKKQVHLYRGLSNISLCLDNKRGLAIIGPSASGKTTLGFICAGFITPKSGEVIIEGEKIFRKGKISSVVQMVFQDPFSSINPQKTIQDWLILSQWKTPIQDKLRKKKRIEKYLEIVNLTSDVLSKHSNQISGGECQRVAIAACLLANAKIMILDEPTSMLDSIATQHVLTAIKQVREETNVATIFITHDLFAAKNVCDEVAFLTEGKIVEKGTFDKLNKSTNASVISYMGSLK